MKQPTPIIVEIAQLTPYKKNARTHSASQIDLIGKSLLTYGFLNPVLIDDKKMIIAGHGRIEAAKKIGLTEAPCIEISHLTPDQKRAYILADNRLAELAEWDYDLLSSELAALDMDFTEIGFDQSFLIADKPALTDEDDVPDAPTDPKCKAGDIWLLGAHRLMCGDSTDQAQVETLMCGEKADMVFTDPPYGVEIVQGKKSSVGGAAPTKFSDTVGKIVPAKTYSKIIGDDTTDAAKLSFEICKKIGCKKFIIWGGNYFTDFLYPSPCWIVWDKENTGNFADVELAWCSEKTGAKLYRHLWNGLARKGDRKTEGLTRVHPTQKPVGLFVEIFKDFKFKTCLDLFGGSGSTLIACEKTDRQCRMMELDPIYCDVIIKRWQDYTGQQATHATTQEVF